MLRFTQWVMTLVVVVCLGAGAANAEEQDGTAAARAFVNSVTQDALAVVQDASLGESMKATKLRALFEDSVDVDWVGKFVLGRYWRVADEEQRERFIRLYRLFLIGSYIPRFREYTGEEITILGARVDEDGGFVVKTEIHGTEATEAAVRVDYRLHEGANGKLQMFDIVAEGVSLLTTQRSDFGSAISRKGLDAFLGRLEKKVHRLKQEGAIPEA